jgi:hypothetical protein
LVPGQQQEAAEPGRATGSAARFVGAGRDVRVTGPPDVDQVFARLGLLRYRYASRFIRSASACSFGKGRAWNPRPTPPAARDVASSPVYPCVTVVFVTIQTSSSGMGATLMRRGWFACCG